MRKSSKLNDRIRQKCESMVEVATQVYYRPIFNRQKELKIPMKDLISREDATKGKIAWDKKDEQGMLDVLVSMREKLERKEKSINYKL